ncbi:MAG TPA: WD40 repeat domain-containing protein, partial [Gemmataceae bacterium]|nr:WD40 repeat domain-containing protein [Gemmataceae bacterium]
SSVDRRLKIWEITSRELPLLAEHSGQVLAVAVSPDGNLIATGSEDYTIKLWNAKTGAEIATLTGHKSVLALTFTPDSKRLISSGEEREMRIWEVSPPREIPRTPQQATLYGPKAISAASSYMALDPKAQTLFVWIPPPPRDMRGVHRIDVIDFANSQFLYDFKEAGRIVKSVVFAPNGTLAATGGADGSVRLWDMNRKEATMRPGGDWILFPKVAFGDIAITFDNARLIGTSTQGDVKIMNIADRKELKSFKAHDGAVYICQACPDNKRFVTYGEDNIIKIWDMEGKELRRWDLGRNQGMFVINMAFTPNGQQIVTANKNSTIYILDLP